MITRRSWSCLPNCWAVWQSRPRGSPSCRDDVSLANEAVVAIGRCPTRWQCVHALQAQGPPKSIASTAGWPCSPLSFLGGDTKGVQSPKALSPAARPAKRLGRGRNCKRRRMSAGSFSWGGSSCEQRWQSCCDEMWICGGTEGQLAWSLQRLMEQGREKLSRDKSGQGKVSEQAGWKKTSSTSSAIPCGYSSLHINPF